MGALPPADICELFESINAKLKIEIEKTYIFEQLSRINGGLSIEGGSLTKAAQNLLNQSSESLGSANFDLNQKAVEATFKLVSILKDGVTPRIAEELLLRSKILLNDGKVPSYLDLLIEKHSKLFAPYAEQIVKAAEYPQIVKLLNSKIIDLKGCLATLKSITIDKNETYKKISVILGKIGVP